MACQYKQENPDLKVIVTGCLAERYKQQIIQEIPEVDAVVGIGSNAALPAIVRRLCAAGAGGAVRRGACRPGAGGSVLAGGVGRAGAVDFSALAGAGGTGAPLGAFLAKLGADVTLIARGAHLKAMQEKGLTFAIEPIKLALSETLEGNNK